MKKRKEAVIALLPTLTCTFQRDFVIVFYVIKPSWPVLRVLNKRDLRIVRQLIIKVGEDG